LERLVCYPARGSRPDRTAAAGPASLQGLRTRRGLMCQHLTIEEMIRLHREPPPGSVRPTAQDLMEKLFTVVKGDGLLAIATMKFNGCYRQQLRNLSIADVVTHLMDEVVMNPAYTPQAGRFNAYAVKSIFLYGSRLCREEKRGRAAVSTHATAAPRSQPEPPRDKRLQRAWIQHGNTTIPEALMAATSPGMTNRERKMITRDKALFAAALIAGIFPELIEEIFPELKDSNDPLAVPMGKIGLRKLIDQTDMPDGTTNKLWGEILRWKRRNKRKELQNKRGELPRRRGFQTLLAECCGLHISTVSRSLASSRREFAEPYKSAVARVVKAVTREQMGSSSGDPT
jgi:hypothetical protein